MDRLFVWFLGFAVLPVLLGVASAIWTAWLFLLPGSHSLLVPIGATMMLLQAAFAIAAFGLLAERMRQLAPTHWKAANRGLACVFARGGAAPETVLIRNSEEVRLAGERTAG